MTWPGRVKIRAHEGGRHGGRIALGRTLVPRVASLEIEGAEGHPDATVRCEVRNGRPEVVEIVVRAKPDGRGIRSADMSTFNIDNLTVNIFAEVAIYPESSADRPAEWTATSPPSEDAWWAMRGDLHEARTATRGRRGPSRDELERVASLYRAHSAAAPVQVIAAQLGLSKRTAERRVEQARAAGLLPPTTPGRKGV